MEAVAWVRAEAAAARVAVEAVAARAKVEVISSVWVEAEAMSPVRVEAEVISSVWVEAEARFWARAAMMSYSAQKNFPENVLPGSLNVLILLAELARDWARRAEPTTLSTWHAVRPGPRLPTRVECSTPSSWHLALSLSHDENGVPSPQGRNGASRQGY